MTGYEQSFSRTNSLEFSDSVSEYSKRHSIIKHQKYKFQPYLKAGFHKKHIPTRAKLLDDSRETLHYSAYKTKH